MKASELIAALQMLMERSGSDPEVLAQSHGCCYHGHDIDSVEMGRDKYKGVHTGDEVGTIVIRV